MTAKEFYEKHKGEYFMYKNHEIEIVRLVGFADNRAIVSLYSKGWATSCSLKEYESDCNIDETLFDGDGKLWYASIEKLAEVND